MIFSRKLCAYLDQLVEGEGYGDNHKQVIERLVWDRVNDLLASGMLIELVDSVNPRPRTDYCGDENFCDCRRYAALRSKSSGT